MSAYSITFTPCGMVRISDGPSVGLYHLDGEYHSGSLRLPASIVLDILFD